MPLGSQSYSGVYFVANETQLPEQGVAALQPGNLAFLTGVPDMRDFAYMFNGVSWVKVPTIALVLLELQVMNQLIFATSSGVDDPALTRDQTIQQLTQS